MIIPETGRLIASHALCLQLLRCQAGLTEKGIPVNDYAAE